MGARTSLLIESSAALMETSTICHKAAICNFKELWTVCRISYDNSSSSGGAHSLQRSVLVFCCDRPNSRHADRHC